MSQKRSGYFELFAVTSYITFCIFFFLGKQLTGFVLLYRVKMHPLDKFPFRLSGLKRFTGHIFPVLRVKSDR